MKYLTIALWQKIKNRNLPYSFSLKAIFFGLLGLIAQGSFFAPIYSRPLIFQDTQGHWAEQCIEQLAQRNIMSAYSSNLFQPNFSMNRGDYAAMIINAFPDAPLKRMEQSFDFIDIPETYWGIASIREAWLTGFVIGYPGNIFLPFEPISRLEVVLSLMAGLEYIPEIPEIPEEVSAEEISDETLEDEEKARKEHEMMILRRLQNIFSDAEDIPPYAREAILNSIDYDLIVNYPNRNQFRPNDPATRAEISAFLCQALDTTGVIPQQYIADE